MLEILMNSSSVENVKGEFVKTYGGVGGVSEWVVPEGVRSICVVCVGHGSGGGGGLSWRNNIPVTPGETLMLSAGGNTSNSRSGAMQFYRRTTTTTMLCIAYSGGFNSGSGTLVCIPGLGGKTANAINDGGGNGGNGPIVRGGRANGGAGGYLGNGGNGTNDPNTSTAGDPNGGGGSGGRFLIATDSSNGGGVGLYGIGITGASAPTGIAANGNDGSPAAVMCGGGDGSRTDRLNCGIRIVWGDGYSYPYNAIIDTD